MSETAEQAAVVEESPNEKALNQAEQQAAEHDVQETAPAVPVAEGETSAIMGVGTFTPEELAGAAGKNVQANQIDQEEHYKREIDKAKSELGIHALREDLDNLKAKLEQHGIRL